MTSTKRRHVTVVEAAWLLLNNAFVAQDATMAACQPCVAVAAAASAVHNDPQSLQLLTRSGPAIIVVSTRVW